MQLNNYVSQFKALNINIVAISYDPFEQNHQFSTDQNLEYAVLADQEATTVKAFGILNEDYAPGHPAYGIPHPGVVFANRDGLIGLKRAVPGYQLRPDMNELLNAVTEHVAIEQ